MHLIICLLFYFRTRDGVDVGEVAQFAKRYQILDDQNKFVINLPDVSDAGEFACSVSELGETAIINVAGKFHMSNRNQPKPCVLKTNPNLVFFCNFQIIIFN